MNMIRRLDIEGVPHFTTVTDVEDGHFVVRFVWVLIVVVRCKSLFGRKFFYFALRIFKRFHYCGNLFCVVRGSPFFGLETSTEHLISGVWWLARSHLSLNFNPVSPVFYRALTQLYCDFFFLLVFLLTFYYQFFFILLFYFERWQALIEVRHLLDLKQVHNFGMLLPTDIIRCRFLALIEIKEIFSGRIMDCVLLGDIVLGWQHCFYLSN